MRAMPVNTGKEGKRLGVIPVFRGIQATLINHQRIIFSVKK
jgi:hypothetical protein